MDLTFLQKFTKGDEAKMKKYIGLYLSIAPGIFENMNNNIQNKEWEDLRINAHSLKPQADYMGLPELKNILEKIEDSVKTQNLENIKWLYQKAHESHLEAVDFLSDKL